MMVTYPCYSFYIYIRTCLEASLVFTAIFSFCSFTPERFMYGVGSPCLKAVPFIENAE